MSINAAASVNRDLGDLGDLNWPAMAVLIRQMPG
jgi:hypothetical protein